MKILCVDDNVANLRLLEMMLRGSGYGVVSAHNGVEALQKLELDSFDLIIADILMPQMDGFELCHQVKQREPVRHIPFIFYTATYTDRKDEELALSLGAARFVIKPADPERFLSMIRDVLLEHRSGQLPAPAQPLEKEEVLLKSYNRRLVQKLEKKVRELEELRRDLDQRVQQRTAELLAANKELETFTSAVSHDLRSPLRAIAGHAQILALRSGDQLPPQSKSSLEALQSGVCRMDCLIEALLQLSRAGRAELHREQVNLSQMAIEIEGELRRENPSRDVQFTVAPDLHAQGDPILLRTLLRNLLANAWKFTAKSPEARVEFGLKQQNGQRAFFVHDNGAGFNMEAAGKLFAPFQRLHPSSEFPGTGIGLATVQQIVCRHGGSIRAEGAVNQGATFQFTLP